VSFDSGLDLPEFQAESDYRDHLRTLAALPRGFSAGTTRLSFVPQERPTLEPYRMNLSLILADEPIRAFGGVFTRNAFPGAPVLIARERMSAQTVRGVLINNKIANVRAVDGLRDAHSLTQSLGERLGLSGEEILSVSTGIIGWKLPIREMEAALPDLVTSLGKRDSLDVADAIMTTDSFPKIRRVALGEGALVGIAKGAGMIEPDMATMLVFILTDVDVEREVLRASLRRAAGRSFNRISVDGDMSTSDMVLFLSSSRVPGVSEQELRQALDDLCDRLAGDIVRNGEGTGHVVRVEARELPDDRLAAEVAKAIVNSPLVKTAVFGNDPNVGRILSAIGDFAGRNGIDLDPTRIRIRVGDELVFTDGAFHIDREKEIRLSEYLKVAALNPRLRGYPQHQREVRIEVSCGAGSGESFAIGADLSDQYVRENADYRT